MTAALMLHPVVPTGGPGEREGRPPRGQVSQPAEPDAAAQQPQQQRALAIQLLQ